MTKDIKPFIKDAIELLKQLISVPSFSKEESGTAALLASFLQKKGIDFERKGNNIWAFNQYKEDGKPCILLNSHHDTVKPNTGYTRDPFKPDVEDGKLYGLGSNDAGGCLVSLLACFLYYYEQPDLAYNICILASAEEEISGKNGVESVIKYIEGIDFAIVGEPTQLNLAVAEKGLMVLDCEALGVAGHAARGEGENALYKALDAVEWFRKFEFPKTSEFLGPIKMTVTLINAGTQHNVVPARCTFVVDVRTTDVYSNQEVLDLIKKNVDVSVTPRSTRLNPSTISTDHPIVSAGIALGAKMYGSPTMSDQALIPYPSIKVGPGDSARSHAANEYIFLKEVEEGVVFYINLLKQIII